MELDTTPDNVVGFSPVMREGLFSEVNWLQTVNDLPFYSR